MAIGILTKEIMIKNVAETKPDKSIQETAQTMKQRDVGMLVICENNSIVGVITREDIINKVVATGADPAKILVRDVMTMNPLTCSPSQDISDVAKYMIKHGYKRLPVIENGKLTGIISYQEIIRILPAETELLQELQKHMGPAESPIKPKTKHTEGTCESCSNFSDQLFDTEKGWLCPTCKND